MISILKTSACLAACVYFGISCGLNNKKPDMPSNQKKPPPPENVPPKQEEDIPKPENVPPKKKEEDPLKAMKEEAENRIKDCEKKNKDADNRALELKTYIQNMKEPWFWQSKYFYENRAFALRAIEGEISIWKEYLNDNKEEIKNLNSAEKLQTRIMEINNNCRLFSDTTEDFISWFMDPDEFNKDSKNKGKEQSYKVKIEDEKKAK